MSPRNDYVSSMRRPSVNERNYVAVKWNAGTSVSGLRKLQGIVLGIAIVMGVLRGLGDGANVIAALGTCLAVSLLFSPLLLLWNIQITKATERLNMLCNGQFSLTDVEGERAVVNRWNMYYVGFGTAKLADGTVLKNVHIPYKRAAELEKRGGSFRAYLVLIDGESKPIMIPYE